MNQGTNWENRKGFVVKGSSFYLDRWGRVEASKKKTH